MSGSEAGLTARGGAWGSSIPYAVGLALPSAIAALACLPAGISPGARASSGGSALLAIAFVPAAYLTAYVVLTFRDIGQGVAAALTMWWLCLQSFVATFVFGLISMGLLIPFVAAICVGRIAFALHRRQKHEMGEFRSPPRIRSHLMLLVALLAMTLGAIHAMAGQASATGFVLVVALGFAPHAAVCWDALSGQGRLAISWQRVSALVALAWALPALHRVWSHGIEGMIWPISVLF